MKVCKTMKLADKLPIDLLEFFRSGRFDSLRPGKTQEFILHNLPGPDGFDPSGLAPVDGRELSIWSTGTSSSTSRGRACS